MSFSKLLSRIGNLSQGVLDDATLKILDKQLMQATKKPGIADKLLSGYNKAYAAGYLPNKAVYGGKFDAPRLATPFGLTVGGLTFGGKAAASPFLNSLNAAYAKLAPSIAAKGAYPLGLSNMALVKPGLAVGNQVGLGAAKGLSALGASKLGAGLGAGKLGTALGAAIAAHPLAGVAAIPLGGAAAIAGTRALMSRVGQARRLNLLRKGIAPKRYAEAARSLGFK